jgi:PAS domain S-box-containing protein
MRGDLARDPLSAGDLPALVWVAREGGATVFGAGWEAFAGLTTDGLAGKSWLDFVHPADRDSALDGLHAAFESGVSHAFEWRLRRADGAMRWHAVGVRRRAGEGAGEWACVAVESDARRRETDLAHFLALAHETCSACANPAEALERVARAGVPALADWCAAYAIDAEGVVRPLALVGHDGPRAAEIAASFAAAAADVDGAFERALSSGKPALVTAGGDPFLAAIGASEAILVPIVARTGRLGIWQFALADRSRALGPAELGAAFELATRASAAFDESTMSQRRAAADLRFLAEVGESMGESLDLPSRLVKFVRGVVPRLADWATVNLVSDDGSLETVAVAHGDPAKRDIAERLYGPYYGSTTSYTGTPVAIREQRSILLRGVDENVLRIHIRPDMYDDVAALGADAAFIVPLVAHGRAYGTLSAMRTERERPFTQSEMWLIEELARRAALAIANARLIERDRTVADAFQRASLPASLPRVPGFHFDAFYTPGRMEAKIGGDWYDAFVLGDGRIAFSLGDVAGSGLSAAVIMNGVRQILRGIAHLEPDPATMLDAADRALRSEYPDCIVTAVAGVLDPRTRSLSIASAGHPSPLVRTAGGVVEEIALRGLPLGLRDASPTPVATRHLNPGDILVLYTDGLTESTRDVVEGERRLFAAVARPDMARARDVAAALVDSILFDGSFDDVAILTIGVDETIVHRFETSDGRAAHGVLESYLDALRAEGASADALDGAAIVFLELVGNAVCHAPGPIETRLSWNDGYAALEVLDGGRGFALERPHRPSDPLDEGGRGLFLVSSLSREFRVESSPGGTRAVAVLDVRRGPGAREMSHP